MTFYIESGTGRQITDPSQADPSKFYVESGTGKQVQGSQLKLSLPNLSGTQSNSPAQVPIQTPTLPNTSNQSPLLSFADSLNKAVNLARQNRNTTAVGIMKPFRGTVAASDFNSILGNLNSASDTFASDLLKNASKSTEAKYDTLTIGGDLYQVQKDASGQVIGKPTLLLKNPNPSSTSDAKSIDNDVASAIIDFQNQINTKGWAGANPDAYNYYRNELIKLYGASAALKLDKAMAEAGITVDTNP